MYTQVLLSKFQGLDPPSRPCKGYRVHTSRKTYSS